MDTDKSGKDFPETEKDGSRPIGHPVQIVARPKKARQSVQIGPTQLETATKIRQTTAHTIQNPGPQRSPALLGQPRRPQLLVAGAAAIRQKKTLPPKRPPHDAQPLREELLPGQQKGPLLHNAAVLLIPKEKPFQLSAVDLPHPERHKRPVIPAVPALL